MPLLLPLKRKTRKKLFVEAHRAKVYRVKTGIAKGKMLRITKERPRRGLGGASMPSEVRMKYYFDIARMALKGDERIAFPKVHSALESNPARRIQGQMLSERVKAANTSTRGVRKYYKSRFDGFRTHERMVEAAEEITKSIYYETGIKINWHAANAMVNEKGQLVFFDIYSINKARLEHYLNSINHPEKEKILRFLDRAEKRLEDIPD